MVAETFSDEHKQDEFRHARRSYRIPKEKYPCSTDSLLWTRLDCVILIQKQKNIQYLETPGLSSTEKGKGCEIRGLTDVHNYSSLIGTELLWFTL